MNYASISSQLILPVISEPESVPEMRKKAFVEYREDTIDLSKSDCLKKLASVIRMKLNATNSIHG